ncbi:Ppx/GppA phosphatase family protein [Maribellus mangrovi]|uniref:Ppx/GppA phosphatase family protein n=1 Tax=Maribellus mangrovi TaxID=3133146 RepID=UPI0030ECB902
MRIAVIDLGTNTCNLLVAEMSNKDFKILHQSKQLVKLGDDKIRDNEISPAATERTIDSFRMHKNIIKEFNVDAVRVIATSAVRSADNKVEYLEKLGEESGWLVKVVKGEKEAELIFEGVLLAFKKLETTAVILDIGGGSNELILAKDQDLLWKESQPTGMARIINQFELSDPIQKNEIAILEKYFAEQHVNTIIRCKEQEVKMLVGCSGAFDTIADMIDGVEPGEKQRTTQEIKLNDFYTIYNKLITSTREERIKMKGMDHVRLDLIVPAVILIETLVKTIGIKKIVQTDFALREGVLYELMHKN